ncbi:MAG: alanine--tRNA ligase [Saprospiraceae bacterium]
MDFFESKKHKIVPSAPIVNKDDPTLLFTNAGMNQFKDLFLGNQTTDNPRIADTQKCLRVSGKHNDLEEVGRDSYHHTMFEMLGNWSIGDYFKEEAIAFAWELLTDIYGLSKDRLYVSVFEGDEDLKLSADEEAANFWKAYVPADRILYFDRKDNFWEMGDTGPCGPCSEIHVDLRTEEDRAKVDGGTLVNMDHPLVIEIWNLVFIQFNRKADGSLEELPNKHVDTGMGFERLTMAIQGKTSNYDTDIFTPFIQALEKESGIKYTFSYEADAKTDIAMRVIADHLRAVSFAIADGQLPSNTGAGYVIRRILRRAVRYYYSFLNIKQPYIYRLVNLLADRFAHVFPELVAQKDQVARIIEGEEKAFLNTLENGLSRFASLEIKNKVIDGQDAFELYDTYGFPIDLTRLLAEENDWTVDLDGFDKALAAQKARSRKDAVKSVGDWTTVHEGESVEFVGYDDLVVESTQILKYRTVQIKKKNQYQVVLQQTPFYAQSGGQAGDTGTLMSTDEQIKVLDTQKENDLIIHIVDRLPRKLEANVRAEVQATKRQATSNNHSAVHLMHAALHQVIGTHALQKGQDVDHKRLRFDFSHFQKMTDEELQKLEDTVNDKIRANIQLDEQRAIPVEEAKAAGAMMLFGEKYGDLVRMITFDPDFSRELCGGTHVQATGEIGLFKIISESAVAAGIRRIEAITADQAQNFIKTELGTLDALRDLFKNSKDVLRSASALQDENKALKKEIDRLQAAQAAGLKQDLLKSVSQQNGVNFLAKRLPLQDSNAIKNLAYQLEKELGNALIVFAAEIKQKPQIMIVVSRELAEAGTYHAGNMIRELAKNIKGGGGGQPFFATAGGKDVNGLDAVIEQAANMV